MDRNSNINGCGGKGRIIDPPYAVFFEASCMIHDNNYFIGGSELDRLTADEGFLKYMLKDCQRETGFSRVYYVLWAYCYYYCVRVFGYRYFNYR